ncbi:hypothetical protein cyc_07760 [Cyclospora cayetanensis]|uniref:Uncharacterized protein n=1 Tax=Cyclospora cayetanensis TaxID=88456 RepID=A0A1D3D1R3_9EIME|nr:hypothetical protein cyc_07760 [Cyclospora cayetanensis]
MQDMFALLPFANGSEGPQPEQESSATLPESPIQRLPPSFGGSDAQKIAEKRGLEGHPGEPRKDPDMDDSKEPLWGIIREEQAGGETNSEIPKLENPQGDKGAGVLQEAAGEALAAAAEASAAVAALREWRRQQQDLQQQLLQRANTSYESESSVAPDHNSPLLTQIDALSDALLGASSALAEGAPAVDSLVSRVTATQQRGSCILELLSVSATLSSLSLLAYSGPPLLLISMQAQQFWVLRRREAAVQQQ